MASLFVPAFSTGARAQARLKEQEKEKSPKGAGPTGASFLKGPWGQARTRPGGVGPTGLTLGRQPHLRRGGTGTQCRTGDTAWATSVRVTAGEGDQKPTRLLDTREKGREGQDRPTERPKTEEDRTQRRDGKTETRGHQDRGEGDTASGIDSQRGTGHWAEPNLAGRSCWPSHLKVKSRFDLNAFNLWCLRDPKV